MTLAGVPVCTAHGCGLPLNDAVHHRGLFAGCGCRLDDHEPHCHWVGSEFGGDTDDD